MKSSLGETPLNRSALRVLVLDDIVYSPNKYRETEGVKESKGHNSKSNARILV